MTNVTNSMKFPATGATSKLEAALMEPMQMHYPKKTTRQQFFDYLQLLSYTDKDKAMQKHIEVSFNSILHDEQRLTTVVLP